MVCKPKDGNVGAHNPTQRVQVANVYALWSQIALWVWVWGLEASSVEYLDALGSRGRVEPYRGLGFMGQAGGGGHNNLRLELPRPANVHGKSGLFWSVRVLLG